MIRERLWPEAVDPVELLELYRLLSGRQNELGVGLLRLLSRIEHYLYERLSIEEIEAIVEIGPESVEALSKKL